MTEQIVLDERKRLTWLVVPGIIGHGRAFAADKRTGRVSEQLRGYLREKLERVGGAILLRNVPAETVQDWFRGLPMQSVFVQRYRREIPRYFSDARFLEMGKQAVKNDRRRITKINLNVAKELAGYAIRRGEDTEFTRFFTSIERADALAAHNAALLNEKAELESQTATLTSQTAALTTNTATLTSQASMLAAATTALTMTTATLTAEKSGLVEINAKLSIQIAEIQSRLANAKSLPEVHALLAELAKANEQP